MSVPFDLPSTWSWCRLSTIAEIRNGFTPRRDNPSYWTNGNIPWFTISDKNEQGVFINRTAQHITNVATTAERIVPANSVLLCCTASVGEVAYTNIPLTTNQQFNGITIKENYHNIVDSFFLLFFSFTLKDLLKKELATATTFGFVSVTKVGSIMMPIPPLKEQIKIVDKLNAIFSEIEKINTACIDKDALCDKLKYKILDSFFSDNSRYKSYYEYEENCLSNIATLITKGSTPTTYGFEYLTKGINFIKVENVKDYCVQHNTIKQFISEVAHEFQKRSQLEKDDLLISIAGTLGRICLIKDEDLPANTNQAFAIVRGYTQTILPDYLKWFITWYVDSKTQQLGHGGGMDNLTLGDIKALKIKYPISIDEQQQIIDKVNACLAIVSAIEGA